MNPFFNVNDFSDLIIHLKSLTYSETHVSGQIKATEQRLFYKLTKFNLLQGKKEVLVCVFNSATEIKLCEWT